MKTLTKENIYDILYGCTLLGTGGGGSLEAGIEMVEKDIKAGRGLKLLPLEELPDDALVATPYGCGAPEELGAAQEKSKYEKIDDSAAALAFRGLEEHLGSKFYAVSSTELGGENTAEALHIASLLGRPLIDGDPAGRSVPELQHSSYYVAGEPIYPMAVATNYGETIILNKVIDDLRAEEIVRSIAVVSGNEVGVADHPMTGAKYKDCIIPGAISYAMNIGKTLREARDAGKDVASAVAKEFEGRILFKGRIVDTPWECRDGFNYGNIYIDGCDDFMGDKYRIWMKNENIVAYKNDKVEVSVPDLICMIGEDGIPVTNPNWKKNQLVTILALPAPEVWKTEKGLAAFGPRSFGLDFDYKPFEK